MATDDHINVLYRELDWLQSVIDQVICSYLQQEGHENRWIDIPLPSLEESQSPYAKKVKEWELDAYERLALALALAPHLRPEALDIFFGKNRLYDRGFTEFGGVIDKSHSGFLPTGQTLCFLVTATNPEWRGKVSELLDPDNLLASEGVLKISQAEPYVPQLSSIISLDHTWLQYFLTGKEPQMEHSAEFPAHKITTAMHWDDVVLDDQVMEQIAEIQTWLEHGETLMNEWRLSEKIKPGFRALFYGPPGTGKTLTATLLGKSSGRDVYRIDLSMIVSKYIGETEKNLSKVFETARNKKWILFFDEADALFGKRTTASSSNDRHANQQTAHLLQEIEDFPGVVLLATNLKANMDEAFLRRFQSSVHFTMPSAEERYRLWQNAFSGACTLHPDIDLYRLAEDHELAGGSIINVLRHCALSAIRRNDSVVTRQELMLGLKREFKKENKTVTINTRP